GDDPRRLLLDRLAALLVEDTDVATVDHDASGRSLGVADLVVRREPGNGLDAVDLAVDELLRAEIFLADGVLPELQVVVYVDIALDRLQVLRAEPDQRIAVRDQVHRRRADKGRDEGVRRRLVDLPGRADLLDATVIQHGDPMTHTHRLDLIVRHVD